MARIALILVCTHRGRQIFLKYIYIVNKLVMTKGKGGGGVYNKITAKDIIFYSVLVISDFQEPILSIWGGCKQKLKM